MTPRIEMDRNTRLKVRQMYQDLKKKNIVIPDIGEMEEIAQAIRAVGKSKGQ